MRSILRSWFPFPLPLFWIFVAVLVVAACEGAYFVEIYFGADGVHSLRSRDGCVVLFTAAAALARAYHFHPRFHQEYASWLALTPWNSSQPLPCGPVHLTVQEVVLLAIPAIVLHDPWIPWAIYPLVYLSVYLAVIAASLYSEMKGYCYAILFGVGLAIRCSMWPELALAVAGLTYVVAAFGIQAWLARFPFPDWPQQSRGEPLHYAGWPFTDLCSTDDSERCPFGTWTYAPLALLSGWFVYCLIAQSCGEATMDLLRQQDQPEKQMPIAPLVFLMMMIPAPIFLAFYRYFLYAKDAAPPFDWLGRLLAFRWIIPGYDIIYLAPVAMGVVPLPLVYLLFMLGVPVGISCGITATVLGLLFTSCPPSWTTWRLTGDYRMTPNSQFVANGSIREI